VNTPVFEKMLK
jgi:tRNA (uracil-5-)-methyltransferase